MSAFFFSFISPLTPPPSPSLQPPLSFQFLPAPQLSPCVRVYVCVCVCVCVYVSPCLCTCGCVAVCVSADQTAKRVMSQRVAKDLCTPIGQVGTHLDSIQPIIIHVHAEEHAATCPPPQVLDDHVLIHKRHAAQLGQFQACSLPAKKKTVHTVSSVHKQKKDCTIMNGTTVTSGKRTHPMHSPSLKFHC